MTSAFQELGLGPEVLRAVADAGYNAPTPIQQRAIPHVLAGKDVLGCAQTGTGKTASFTLPMLELLSRGRARARMPRSLILEPTRELAAQVEENFNLYGKYHKFSCALLIGGVSFGEQERKIDRGVDVLIATPGRLLDHCERGKVLLTGAEILVIDEADRMLDMGFIPDVERILSMIPATRQTVMFSATMPAEVRRLADRFLRDPVAITVDPPSSTASTVTQGVLFLSPRQKRATLRKWLDAEGAERVLVFCNRKRDVAELYRSLARSSYVVGALHGDMDQYKRMECLEQFRSGAIRVLVCSDVAARGLDIPAVDHVFNYDVPVHAEDYVHRIGRTGRAGKSGIAHTLATEEERKHIQAIEELIGQILPVLQGIGPDDGDETEDSVAPAAAARPARRRRAPLRADKPNAAAPAAASVPMPAFDPEASPELDPDETEEDPIPAPLPVAHRESAGGRIRPEAVFGDSEWVPAFLRRSLEGL